MTKNEDPIVQERYSYMLALPLFLKGAVLTVVGMQLRQLPLELAYILVLVSNYRV